MAAVATDIRSAEYGTLRDEILQNKQYVFERPLLIVAAVGVGAVQLSDRPSVLVLPLLLVVVLLANLWFTVNRLGSTARIVAYIQVVLEPTTGDRWIGWETSLRIHRTWMNKHTAEERAKALEPFLNRTAIHDAMMWYPALFWLHVAIVVVAVSASGLAVLGSPNILQYVSFAMTLAAAFVFAVYCLGPYRPSKMADLIEVQRATWLAVLYEATWVRTRAP